MITLPWLTKTMEFEALHPRRRGGQFGKKPTNNGPSLFDRDSGGGWKASERFAKKDSDVLSSDSVLEKIQASPQFKDREVDWVKYADRWNVKGEFVRAKVDPEVLKKLINDQWLRIVQPKNLNEDAVKSKQESGDRSDIIITTLPGGQMVVMDGNHSLVAAIRSNDKSVNVIYQKGEEGRFGLSQKSPSLPWLTKKLGDIRGDSIKQSRGGVRAHWHDYAKKANIDPDELHTIAAEYKHHHDEAAGEKHNMLADAKKRYSKFGNLNNLRHRNRNGTLDADSLHRFDELADEIQAEYPHFFSENDGAKGDAGDQLFAMLGEDAKPEEMDWEDAYKFAANHIDSKPEREPGSEDEIADSDEFGLGSDSNDFDFGANEKPATTPKEEADPHADAKKLEAKLAKKNPNGFTGIKRNQGFIHGTKVDSDTYDRHRALEKSREPAPEPTKAPAQVQPQQAAPMPANQPNAATAPKQPGATNDFTGWNGTAYMIQGRVVDQATYHAYAEQKKQQAKNQNQATTPAAGRDNPDLEAAFGAPSSGHAQQPTQPAAARPNNDLDDVFNDNTKKTKRTPVSDLKTAVDSVERELETAKKTGHVENIKKHSKKLGEVIEKYRSMGNAELEKRVLEKYGDTPKSRQFADKAKASFGKSLDERKAKVLGAGGSGKGKPQAKPQTGQSKQTQVSANVNNGPEFHENNRALHAILQGHDDDLKKQGMDWEERSKVLRGISDAYKNHYEDLQKSNPTGGKENFNQAMRAKYDLKKGLIPEGGNAQATQTPQKNRLRDVVEAAKKDPKAFYESQKAGYIADGMGERDAHRQALNNMHMHGIPGGVPIDRKLRGALDENQPAASAQKPSGIGLGADAFNQMVDGETPAPQQKPQPQAAPTPPVKPTGNLPHHKTQANVLNAANEYARNAKNPDHDARAAAFKKARSALKDHHAAGIAHLDSLQTGGNRRQIAKAKKAFTDRMRAIESKLGALGGFQARVKTQTPVPGLPVKQNQAAGTPKTVEPPPINPQYGRSRDQHKLTQQHLHERQKQSMRDLQDKHDQQLEALQRRLSGRGGPRLNTRGGLLGLAAGMMAGDNRAKNRRLVEQLKDKQANIEAKLAKRHRVQRQQMANRHKLRISQIPTTKKGLMEWLTPSVDPIAAVGRLPWMVKAIYDETLHPRAKNGEFTNGPSLAGEKGASIRTDGGRIDIQHETKFSPRKQSVIDFVVDEDKRGHGIGDKLLKEALRRHDDLGGQVSSMASLKLFYKNGFRNPELPNGSFEDHVKEFKDSSGSLYMAHKDEDGNPYVKNTIKSAHLPWLTKNAAFEALHPRANDGKFSRENEVSKLVKDAVGVQPMTQARAKEGGEIGPNGEWYRGGSFIATTELPKRIKKKLEQSAKGKVNVEPGQKWEVPEPGKMSIIDKLGGTVLNHRDGEVNYQFLAYQQRPPEYIAMVEEVVQKWKDGQRWIDVSEYPLLANHTDIARLVVAGMPVPSEAMDKMPPDVKAHFERYKAKTEQPFPPVPNRG